jgi:hypothetical protein
LVQADEVADAIRRVFRAPGQDVRVRRRALIVSVAVAGGVVIVDVPELSRWPAINAHLRSPQRADAVVGAATVQRRDAARRRAGVKVRQPVPIPEARHVPGRGAETTGEPVVVRHFREVNPFLRVQRRRAKDEQRENSQGEQFHP